MRMSELISKVQSLGDCIVLPPNGLPKVNDNHVLPEEIKEFYSLCGGMNLFVNKHYSVKILPPDEFTLANPLLIDKDIIEEEIKKGTYALRISTNWYTIVDLFDSNYIVIDLSRERLGRCYKAFWDSYPSRGEMPVVAMTFSELLNRLIENKGEYWYFLEDDFISIGDAYD